MLIEIYVNGAGCIKKPRREKATVQQKGSERLLNEWKRKMRRGG